MKLKKLYLSPKEVQQVYGIHPATLSRWRRQRVGPKFVQLGKQSFRYRIEDLENWVQDNTVETGEVSRY